MSRGIRNQQARSLWYKLAVTETRLEDTSSERLAREIGRWSLAALVINCIIGSGVFGLPSVLANLVGRASILAVILAALAVGVIMVCFVRLTACAANADLFVTYLAEFWPDATRPAMTLVILTLLLGILAAINYRGVKAGAQVSTSFTIAKLASLGLVCVAGGFYLIAAHKIVPPPTIAPTSKEWAR